MSLDEPEAVGTATSELAARSAGHGVEYGNGKDLNQRITGRFYTPSEIASVMIRDLNPLLKPSKKGLRILDPFGGDGRLVLWLADAITAIPRFKGVPLHLEVWDCDAEAIASAREKFAQFQSRPGFSTSLKTVDSFEHAKSHFGTFDVVITNPPWEMLKPDRRELSAMTETQRAEFTALLKRKSAWLDAAYPNSKPQKAFSGWGVNLARCGIEAAISLTKVEGKFAIVAPSNIFGDQVSSRLRHWVFEKNHLTVVRNFPAESRLFEQVDQGAVTFVGTAHTSPAKSFRVIDHQVHSNPGTSPIEFQQVSAELETRGYSVTFHGDDFLDVLDSILRPLPTLADLESSPTYALKLGRELDETRIGERLANVGEYPFIKGRDIDRYSLNVVQGRFLRVTEAIKSSANMERVAWRDVARQSTARRMRATLLPARVITGNSINVGYSKLMTREQLCALVGVFNSLVFEAQVRRSITTNHLSVGAIRTLRVPIDWNCTSVARIAQIVEEQLIKPSEELQEALEMEVASWYGLDAARASELRHVMAKFDRNIVIAHPLVEEIGSTKGLAVVIHNHQAPALSALDVITCEAVPPGGNWKDIPTSVPLKRLQTIRESFARGEGSRSTYYGRLAPDKPAYTINTYFTRPGNGCHIHYDAVGGQHRTMSYREAARLQSFPDSFVFKGSKTSIATQIGNAVPPLLAFQIAKHLKVRGQFVDLFSGAGGLGLGFSWAGWRPIVASEYDAAFASTHEANISCPIVVADIREATAKAKIIDIASESRTRRDPLFVLGGPPCQGFSTAGLPRSMEDPRNWLFEDYCAVLTALKPDGFIFENVSGLLNMEGGRVFQMIQRELAKFAKRLFVWKLQAERYAIPQRRTRILIVGDNTGTIPSMPPDELTTLDAPDLIQALPPSPSVKEALDDLPTLVPGQDGSHRAYRHEPQTPYQRLMRGDLTPTQYLAVYRG